MKNKRKCKPRSHIWQLCKTKTTKYLRNSQSKARSMIHENNLTPIWSTTRIGGNQTWQRQYIRLNTRLLLPNMTGDNLKKALQVWTLQPHMQQLVFKVRIILLRRWGQLASRERSASKIKNLCKCKRTRNKSIMPTDFLKLINISLPRSHKIIFRREILDQASTPIDLAIT